MSLQNYLQQYSNQIAARQEHQEEIDNQAGERKAQTLQEKFEHTRDAITSAGAELGSAGAAMHLGRKLYRKMQERRAGQAKSEAVNDAPSQQPPGDGARPTPGAEPAPVSESGGRVKATNDQIGELPDNAYGADGRFQGKKVLKNSQQAREGAEEARDPASATDPASVEHGGADAPVTESSNPASADGINDRAAAIQERVGGSGGAESAETPDFLTTRQYTPLEGGSEPAVPGRESAPTHTGSGANDAPSQATDAPEAPETDVEQGARAFQARADERSASNMRNRIGADGKVASGGDAPALEESSSELPEVLSGVSDALDFVPVVGEVAGVITGLVGLFEGLGHKDTPDETPDAPGEQAQQTAGTGMDTKALMSQPTGGGGVVV